MKYCAQPRCPVIVERGYCPAHQRKSAHQRGYTYRWEQARKQFLSLHPGCVECKREGLDVIATVVDHIRPHRGDEHLFWDRNNWQPLCAMHHNHKTGRGQ